MRKIISFMHISLDGFVAGPNGEMEWIKVDQEHSGQGITTNRCSICCEGLGTTDKWGSLIPGYKMTTSI